MSNIRLLRHRKECIGEGMYRGKNQDYYIADNAEITYLYCLVGELLYTFLPRENPHINSRSFLYQSISDKYFVMTGNNSEIYELWMTIQDIIGRARLWPYLIRRYFGTPHLKLWQRTVVAAFVYVN